jgi:6-phosphogluconolactonase
MNRVIEVLAAREKLIERSLDLVCSQVRAAIAERGICTLVLSGGSTPKPLYEAISEQSLPWEKIHVFWGDERYVPADHPDSNQKMAREAWLDRVNIPHSNIHPIPTDSDNPALDAKKYEQQLLRFFAVTAGEFPTFDIVLLGIGDDGHTASLFPHTAALKVSDRLVTMGNKDNQPRITLTAPLINQARCVIFLVTGANKRPALAQIFAPTTDTMTYPASLIQPFNGQLFWLLDSSAGAEINPQ